MKILLSLSLSILFLSCNSHSKKAETIIIIPELITDSLDTRMPGALIKCDDYLVWFDPFSMENFLKVIKPETGKLIGEMGKIGQGPDEFSTPSVEYLNGNSMLVTDLNSDKQAVFSIDSLMNGDNPYYFKSKADFKDATRIVETDINKYVALYPMESKPFKIIINQKSISFGKYPVDKKISNGYEVFQGDLKYNKKRKVLVYSVFYYPYMAVYKNSKNGVEFELENEKVICKPDYSIVDREMRMKEKTALISEIALTKDYIVTIQKKELKEGITEKNNIKPPETLYLYDYGLNLLKIIDTQVPVLRLASDGKSNTIYAIIINPEYSIVKIEL